VCIAIWSSDRLLRLARVAYLGLIPRFTKGVKATATYDASADIIRLDVTALVPKKPIRPGQYYYLYAAGGIESYQSHPFTLCSWRKPTSTTTTPLSSLSKTEDAKGPVSLPSLSITSTETGKTTSTQQTLLIRPYKGLTASLKKRLTPFPKDITVLLEGPYGPTLDLSSFSDLLFLAGGSGITPAVSHLTHLLPSRKTNVHVVWAAQTTDLVENVCENELAAALRDPGFRLTVYATRWGGVADAAATLDSSLSSVVDSPGNAEDTEKEKVKSKATGSSYPVLRGRPDLTFAIRDARKNCTRNLAVVVCGPPRMADACRKRVVEVLGDEGAGPEVEFFNEAMGW